MQQVFDINELSVDRRQLSAPGLRKSRAWRYLSEADRTLLELSERGLSCRLIGQAVGLNAGTVTRRLATIKARLASPLARFALDPTTALPEAARDVSLQYAITGLRPAAIARALNMSAAQVRDHLSFAQGVMRGASRRLHG